MTRRTVCDKGNCVKSIQTRLAARDTGHTGDEAGGGIVETE